MHLFLVLTFLINYSNSIDDSLFRIQPQPIWINNVDEFYITSTDHYIGQVLYRDDQIELSCECQTEAEHTEHNIYWTINDKNYDQYNSSDTIKLTINLTTVLSPITNVKCHCTFIQSNRTKLTLDYKYKLYIDFEGDPSLKPINYTMKFNVNKNQLYSFIHLHLMVIISFIVVIIGITLMLLLLSIAFSQ